MFCKTRQDYSVLLTTKQKTSSFNVIRCWTGFNQNGANVLYKLILYNNVTTYPSFIFEIIVYIFSLLSNEKVHLIFLAKSH